MLHQVTLRGHQQVECSWMNRAWRYSPPPARATVATLPESTLMSSLRMALPVQRPEWAEASGRGWSETEPVDASAPQQTSAPAGRRSMQPARHPSPLHGLRCAPPVATRLRPFRSPGDLPPAYAGAPVWVETGYVVTRTIGAWGASLRTGRPLARLRTDRTLRPRPRRCTASAGRRVADRRPGRAGFPL